METVFKLKQFSVNQAGAAMKIGTDGILLGAWASLDHKPESILDLGAGTGIIALQMAQRSFATTIEAVEIDDAAFEQCSENFENSPWADRLYCYHASVQEFASEIDDKYHLIVSNPPFFNTGTSTGNKARDTARFNDALPFEHLMVCATHLLSAEGIFAVVIPKESEEELLRLGEKSGLYPKRICSVSGNPNTQPKRSLIEFWTQQNTPILESLIIETARHQYTEDYKNLVKDFYLKM